MKRAKPKSQKPSPQPMVFEHAPIKSTYDRIADRVMAAVTELNKALEEAHECVEMRVYLGASRAEGRATHFDPVIYRMTHSTLAYEIKMEPKSEMAWQLVKGERFKDAAGQAWNAMKRTNGVGSPKDDDHARRS